MITLSAFADEISPLLEEQLAALHSEGIHHVELRSVWQINVLDLSDAQLALVAERFAEAGVSVSAIGSPIGKVPIDASFDEHLHRFERAIHVARYFHTSYIRLFSFYAAGGPVEGASVAPHRETVLHYLREMLARARAADIVLLHENEKDIYGDTIERCLDLFRSLDDPRFGAVFDPANFIQCGQRPYPDAYEALRPWLRYVHVKDALADGTVVPAGAGAAEWPALLASLKAAGYEGFLSLEPHLAESSRFSGFSGPERFHQAVQALKGLLQTLDWEFS